MEVTQEGQKYIFMLCMEVAEEDMEVQEETVLLKLFSAFDFFFFLFFRFVHNNVFQDIGHACIACM